MANEITNIESLSPNQAWEIYVGYQSPHEFGPADSVAEYVANAPLCRGLVGSDYDRVVELLTQHIADNT